MARLGRYFLPKHEAYFLACCRYIELNPVRAGMVYHPRAYRWSSYRAHADGANPPTPEDAVIGWPMQITPDGLVASTDARGVTNAELQACSSGTPEMRAFSPRLVCTRPGQSTDTPTPRGRSDRANASE